MPPRFHGAGERTAVHGFSREVPRSRRNSGDDATRQALREVSVGPLSVAPSTFSLLPHLPHGLYGPKTVSSEDPYVRLPDRIELSLAEAGELLEVLDIAAVVARTDSERAAVSSAAHMITATLWPELGGLLDGDDEA